MVTARTLDDFGGEYADALPVEDPTTEQSAAYHNREAADLAALTRTSAKFVFTFSTSAVAAPVVLSAAGITCRTHFGTGSSTKPVVTKSATGVYDCVFAASYNDDLGEAEAITLLQAKGAVCHATKYGHVQCTVAGQTVTVRVFSDLVGTLSDLAGSAPLLVEVF